MGSVPNGIRTAWTDGQAAQIALDVAARRLMASGDFNPDAHTLKSAITGAWSECFHDGSWSPFRTTTD